jgi:uncharacterized protein (TIGR02466 family)
MIEPSLAIALFPTPVIMFDLPNMSEVNAEIAAALLEEETKVPSVSRANVGAWHSAPDLARRSGLPFRTLMQQIVNQVGACVSVLARDAGIEQVPPYRYALMSWAMVMRKDQYVTTHDHGDAHWSVAYYVDAGDEAPAPSGRLAFLDRRGSGRPIPELDLFPSTFEVTPRTSALVVFPGWLQHYVHAYQGTRPRICVSCNITMSIDSPTVGG